jgi:hypothetical protein
VPVPLGYRRPGPEPRSQWVTDDDPRHRWFVALLVALYPVAVVIALLGSAWGALRFLAGC